MGSARQIQLGFFALRFKQHKANQVQVSFHLFFLWGGHHRLVPSQSLMPFQPWAPYVLEGLTGTSLGSRPSRGILPLQKANH